MAVSTESYSLPDSVLEKAKLELNEVPEDIQSAIEELRKSIEESNESDKPPFIRLDDNAFLLRFLRAKKYRQGDALKQYMNYCKYRVKYPEIFDGLCLEKVRYLLEKGSVGILEPKTVNGCPVVVFFPRRIDLSQPSCINDVSGVCLLLMEKLIEEPENQVNGVVMIENWEGVGFIEMVKYQAIAHRESSKFLQLFQVSLSIALSTYHLCRSWYELYPSNMIYIISVVLSFCSMSSSLLSPSPLPSSSL